MDQDNAFNMLFGHENVTTAALQQEIIAVEETQLQQDNEAAEDAQDAFISNANQLLLQKLNADDDPGPRSDTEFYYAFENLKEAFLIQHRKINLAKIQYKTAKQDFDNYQNALTQKKNGLLNTDKEYKAIEQARFELERAQENKSQNNSLSASIKNKLGFSDQSELDRLHENTERKISALNKIIYQKENSLRFLLDDEQKISVVLDLTTKALEQEREIFQKIVDVEKKILKFHSDYEKNGKKFLPLTPAQKKYIFLRSRNFELINHLRAQGFDINAPMDCAYFVTSMLGDNKKKRNYDLFMLLELENASKIVVNWRRGDYKNQESLFKPVEPEKELTTEDYLNELRNKSAHELLFKK